MHAHPLDLFQDDELRKEQDVQHCSEALDEKGIHRPIKDGLEDDGLDQVLAEDEDHRLQGQDAGEETSEDERDIPGTKRPPRGAG